MPLSPSASDWTRFKRLHRSVTYPVIQDAVRTGNPFNPELLQSRVAGRLRTQYEASSWTDYIAASNTDFITIAATPSTFTPQRSVTQLCSCRTSILNTRISIIRPRII
jgi:hypothetical protein